MISVSKKQKEAKTRKENVMGYVTLNVPLVCFIENGDQHIERVENGKMNVFNTAGQISAAAKVIFLFVSKPRTSKLI